MKRLQKISFCLTADEIDTVELARKRLGRLGVLLNRSELIRTAISCLDKLDDNVFRVAAEKTTRLKPGRKQIVRADPISE